MSVELILGDCLEKMKDIPDKSVDLVLTSPPYDDMREYGGYRFCFDGIAKEIFRVIKDGGACVWIVGDATKDGGESGTSFRQALAFQELGFKIHDTMIYEKQEAFISCPVRYNQCFEYMFVFAKGKLNAINLIRDRANKYFGQKHHGTRRQHDGSRKPREMTLIKKFNARKNIWCYGTGLHKTTKDVYAFDHPAMFPENLAQDHIISWSNKGDTVLDPMMGSGTTGKMAVRNDRNFIGIEICPKYFEIAKRRITEEEAKLKLI